MTTSVGMTTDVGMTTAVRVGDQDRDAGPCRGEDGGERVRHRQAGRVEPAAAEVNPIDQLGHLVVADGVALRGDGR